jgi:hypothetical protein
MQKLIFETQVLFPNSRTQSLELGGVRVLKALFTPTELHCFPLYCIPAAQLFQKQEPSSLLLAELFTSGILPQLRKCRYSFMLTLLNGTFAAFRKSPRQT